MWNENTSIYEPEVVKIKNLLIREGIVSESAFELKKNFDVTSGDDLYPVILLLDFSGSLIPVREQLNRATRNFVRTVLESKGVLTKRIDFATVTFASEVKVRRPFGYITEEDLNESCEIRNDEMGGMTSMASGMFVAWYLAEARKQMYKDAGIEDEYKQPVFVLISDLRNTEKTHYDGEYLVQKMVDLFNAKTEAKKLGLVKMLLGQVDQSYNEHLKGIVVGKPEEFAESLEKFFHELLATVAYQKDKEENFDSDEADDDVFQVYGSGSGPKNPPDAGKDPWIELNKLYDED